MTKPIETRRADEKRQLDPTPEPAKAKKLYRKPELSKFEQLHGIGIGS